MNKLANADLMYQESAPLFQPVMEADALRWLKKRELGFGHLRIGSRITETMRSSKQGEQWVNSVLTLMLNETLELPGSLLIEHTRF